MINKPSRKCHIKYRANRKRERGCKKAEASGKWCEYVGDNKILYEISIFGNQFEANYLNNQCSNTNTIPVFFFHNLKVKPAKLLSQALLNYIV